MFCLLIYVDPSLIFFFHVLIQSRQQIIGVTKEGKKKIQQTQRRRQCCMNQTLMAKLIVEDLLFHGMVSKV